MAIQSVDPGDVETFTVITNPFRTYTSSSVAGSTGSIFVFPRRSSIEKDIAPSSAFVDATHDDADLSTQLQSLRYYGRYARVSGSNSAFIASASMAFPGMLQQYMNSVMSQSVSARKFHTLEPVRFTPTVDFTENTVKKSIIREVLSPYYYASYPSTHWAYTNYNCLAFFTSSTVPTSSVLMYPNISDDGNPVHEFGTYTPVSGVSFDFYINPRYRPDQLGGAFKAGTVFHLTSTYAVSLVTGSAKDQNGQPLGFRLQLQLSHSADIPPSMLRPSGSNQASYLVSGSPSNTRSGFAPADTVFLSDDNSLKWNNWHHVVIRWGGAVINQGTGSFNVDGVDRGLFSVGGSTIIPPAVAFAGKGGPDVLCVGNYYEGTNSGDSTIATFFGTDPSLREGIAQLAASAPGIDTPLSYSFNHPLNADLHDLSIKRYYMSDLDIQLSASRGPRSIDSNDVAFYLPPFFVTESPFRQFVGDHGGILQTPFEEVDGTTADPFNVAMSFGVGGHYINIENFLRDFASDVFPRAHHMSGTALENTSETATANQFLYEQPYVRRRNTLVMPCDDGLFVPSYELLASESNNQRAVDDLGIQELSFIHMGAQVSTSSLMFGSDFNGDSSFADEATGYTPEQPGNAPGPASANFANNVSSAVQSNTTVPGVADGEPLSVYERTRDPSSNEVTFFDISNLYYGQRIMPTSVELGDLSLSGSGGALGITLKDDGHGTLYRADALTPAATWNAVGTVYYDEGIIVIKSPHLYFFGQDGYQLSLRGTQSVHVMRFDILAPANQLNSSSNPNYKLVPPSQYPNDPEKEFVYITGMNYHDEDMNVIAKTQLAQPIMKRPGDSILFRAKIDW